MAFENIGIGGVLNFDTRGAVANMGLAQRAFQSLGRAASGVQAGVAKVGAGISGAFGAMSTLGTGAILGVGYGIKKWVDSGVAFNNEMEGAQLAIATILSSVKKTDLDAELAAVPETMMALNKVAAEAPGELTDIVGIFQQMAGPMTVGQASMEEMLKATKGTAILAGVLKRSFNDTGAALSKLTAGQFEAGNDILMMLKSMGLIKETTQEWKALLPEQRVKRIGEILATFEKSGEKVGQTWEAQSSTFASILKMLSGAFTKKLFENMKSGVGKLNDAFMSDSKRWIKAFEDAGEKFGQAIAFVSATVRGFVTYVVGAVKNISKQFERFGDIVDRSVIERFAELGLKIGITAVALSPVVTIVGFLGSKVMSLVSIAQGLVTIFASLAVPLAPVIAVAGALFLLFRRTGEGPLQTLNRGLEYTKQLARDFYDGVSGAINTFRTSFSNFLVSLKKFWAGIQPGMDRLRSAILGIVQMASMVVQQIVRFGAIIFNGFTRAFEAARPGLTKFFNAVMGVVDAVIGAVNYLWPKIMSVVEPIFQVFVDIGVKLWEVIGKVLEFLSPVIEAFTWLWKNVLVPFVGFIVDVFGPVITKVVQGVGWLIEKILGAIGGVIDGISWAAEKAADLADTLFGGPSIVDMMDQIANKGKQAAMSGMTVVEMVQVQVALLKLQAMNALEIMQMVAQGVQEVYNDTLKPLVDQGIKVIQMFSGNAEITAKNPDVKVDVNVNNKSTMCVNGRQLAVATSDYQTEVSERAGFTKTPWQTQRVQISGVKP